VSDRQLQGGEITTPDVGSGSVDSVSWPP